MDDKHYNLLHQSFLSVWAAGDDNTPVDRIVKSFKDKLPQFEKYYCKVDEATILEIIRTKFPDYATQDDPRPAPPRIAPKPLLIDKQTEVTTIPPPAASTGDQEMDDLIAELSQPEPRKRKPKLVNHQTTAKTMIKEALWHWFNVNARQRARGFTSTQVHEKSPAVQGLSERTVRSYLEELHKANRLKCWRKARLLSSGQKVYDNIYTSEHNPDPNYVLWIVK